MEESRMVNVLRMDVFLDIDNLKLEGELQCGKLFDKEKVKAMSEKFVEKLYGCQTKELKK